MAPEYQSKMTKGRCRQRLAAGAAQHSNLASSIIHTSSQAPRSAELSAAVGYGNQDACTHHAKPPILCHTPSTSHTAKLPATINNAGSTACPSSDSTNSSCAAPAHVGLHRQHMRCTSACKLHNQPTACTTTQLQCALGTHWFTLIEPKDRPARPEIV